MTHSNIKTHEKVKRFIEAFPKRKGTIISALGIYLKWRKITIEELIDNGLKEKEYFIQFINENPINRKRTTIQNKVSEIRKFLIFHGIAFPINKRLELKKYYFEDDVKMEEFLLFFKKESTRRVNKFYLSEYCKYREMSPTELIEEAKEKSISELRVQLMKYHRTITTKDSWRRISIIIRFYFRLADKIVHFMQSEKPKRIKKLFHLGKEKVEKETMKELIEDTDLRDTMVLFTLFESGLNPIDLSTLTYGHFKEYLNIDNPDECSDVAVIIHVREKTYCEFLACFGKQSLYYITKWLKYQMKVFGERNELFSLTDDYPIFNDKRYPFVPLSSEGIASIPKRVSKKVFGKLIRSSDFRNSFSTRAKQKLKHYDKELFMGHTGGMERHYDISDLEYFTTEYFKAWEVLFDLTYDNEKVKTLEEENYQMKKALNYVGNVLENFYMALAGESPIKRTNTTKDDLEKAVAIIRDLK